jgi:hypothetical protein
MAKATNANTTVYVQTSDYGRLKTIANREHRTLSGQTTVLLDEFCQAHSLDLYTAEPLAKEVNDDPESSRNGCD